MPLDARKQWLELHEEGDSNMAPVWKTAEVGMETRGNRDSLDYIINSAVTFQRGRWSWR